MLLREHQEKARERLSRGREGSSLYEHRPSIVLARIHALHGEKDEALRWLKEAIARGVRNPLWLRRDPLLENLRDDPRFQQLLAELDAEVARMRERVEREGW